MPAYKYTIKSTGKTKWYANFYYTDWTGERKHVCKRGFNTQREAKEYERHFLDVNVSKPSNIEMTFPTLLQIYLDDLENRLKPTTFENKTNMIENKILPYFKNLKVNEIDSTTIRNWQNEMLNFRKPNGERYAPTYLKTLNSQLSAIFNYGVKHYNLKTNPCRDAGSIGKKKAKKMKIWTQQEYEQFSSTIEKSAMKLAFDILFYTGIRSGELLALTPADILPNKRLNINKNYARVKGKEFILTPKTDKSERCISIPDFLYNDITTYISKLYGIEPNDRIFYFTRAALNLEIKKGAAKVGLEQIRVHDLRHSHVSMLIEMHYSIVAISERLGHESVKITLDTYAHLYPDKDITLADDLNKFRSSN